MRDSDWTILYELSKNPSMTKVAGLMNMTQPSLTKRIRHMEEEFQVKIVERTSHGLKFTKEGNYLAERARLQIDFMEETKRDLEEMCRQEPDALKIGAAYTYVQHELPNILLDFTRKNPNIFLNVADAPSNIVYRRLLEGEYDAGFIRGDYDGNLNRILVKRDHAYLVTAKPHTLSELPQMEQVRYRSNDMTIALLEKWWSEHFQQKISVGSTVGYLDLALQIVGRSDSYMLCFLPQDFENRDNLCLTPLTDKNGIPVSRNTWFVYPQNHAHANLPVLVEYIRQNVEIFKEP